MLCSSLFKSSGKPCKNKAKFVITVDDVKTLFCGRHIVSGGSALLDNTFKTVADIPGCQDIASLAQETLAKSMDIVSDAIATIKATTNLELTLGPTVPISTIGIDYYSAKNDDKKWYLMICKDSNLMTDYYEAMCIQVKAQRTSDVFIPIETYETLNKPYFIAKLVHGSQTNRYPYFYQLAKEHEPLERFDWTDEQVEPFAKHMTQLISSLHSERMCFGDFNFQTLSTLSSMDPSSVRITSARSISFWRDLHGDFKSEDRGCSGTTNALTSSRRVHGKLAPSRYDDFESLLYLILTIQKKILPWHDCTSLRDTTQLKDAFLKDPSLYVTIYNGEALRTICAMIFHAAYDERPSYVLIEKLFKQLAQIQP